MSVDLEVRDVWKSYARAGGGRIDVLEGITFTVARDELVALVGPSGCGKSTLLDMLAGFQRPDRGSITFAGREVTQPGPAGILISQAGSVFPWMTAWRNLAFVMHEKPPEERAAHARHYLELVGLRDFATAYPHQLSGGMLQRLELARALVVRPQALYMDEPFGSLDALTRLRTRQELLRIRWQEPHTTVLVTHDVEEAIALADRIFVLTPRPMRIERVVAIDVPHPRSMSDPRAVAIRDFILHELGVLSD